MMCAVGVGDMARCGLQNGLMTDEGVHDMMKDLHTASSVSHVVHAQSQPRAGMDTSCRNHRLLLSHHIIIIIIIITVTRITWTNASYNVCYLHKSGGKRNSMSIQLWTWYNIVTQADGVGADWGLDHVMHCISPHGGIYWGPYINITLCISLVTICFSAAQSIGVVDLPRQLVPTLGGSWPPGLQEGPCVRRHNVLR